MSRASDSRAIAASGSATAPTERMVCLTRATSSGSCPAARAASRTASAWRSGAKASPDQPDTGCLLPGHHFPEQGHRGRSLRSERTLEAPELPTPGVEPDIRKRTSKRESGLHKAMSQASTRLMPAPTAAPSTDRDRWYACTIERGERPRRSRPVTPSVRGGRPPIRRRRTRAACSAESRRDSPMRSPPRPSRRGPDHVPRQGVPASRIIEGQRRDAICGLGSDERRASRGLAWPPRSRGR